MVTVSPKAVLPPLVFDGINTRTGKARLIGNSGASDVGLIANPAGLHFIEITGTGNVMVTTVFRALLPHTAPGTFAFAHSRHFAMTMLKDGGAAIQPSEHHGMCTILE